MTRCDLQEFEDIHESIRIYLLLDQESLDLKPQFLPRVVSVISEGVTKITSRRKHRPCRHPHPWKRELHARFKADLTNLDSIIHGYSFK